MIRNIGTNKILWFLTALLSLIAASAGVLDPGIYASLVPPKMLPGTVSQDLITVVVAVVVLFWLVWLKEPDFKRQILILGVMGYLFYGYGIWVIERMYNMLYLLYLAIFALSFWSIVYGVASISPEARQRARLGRLTRYASVGWSLLNPVIFYPLWASQLLPLMRASQKADLFYSIWILDLCFVMPALIILGVATARNRGLGLLLTPALFVKGFTLLFSVALGGIIAPFYRQVGDMGQVWFYLALATVFLVLTVVHLWSLRLDGETARGF